MKHCLAFFSLALWLGSVCGCDERTSDETARVQAAVGSDNVAKSTDLDDDQLGEDALGDNVKTPKPEPTTSNAQNDAVSLSDEYSEPDDFLAFEDDFQQPLGEDWETVGGSVGSDGEDLVIQAPTNGDSIARIRRIWKHPLAVHIMYEKNKRWLDLLLPRDYVVRFGGRGHAPEGGHKYGTNVSLLHQGEAQELVASAKFVPGGEQLLEVQLLDGEIRIYCQMLDTKMYLHADGAWRAQVGPCLSHRLKKPGVPRGTIALRANFPGQSHRIRSLAVTEPVPKEGEQYFGKAGPVPTLAEDGLSLPEISHLPMSWAGYAPRVDAPRVDDAELIEYASFVHWGSPDGESRRQIKGVNPEISIPAYMICTMWGGWDKWNSWKAHAELLGIDPNDGKLGDFDVGSAGGSEVAYANLANQHVREFLLAKAEQLAAREEVDAIFFDVTYPALPDGFTRTEWSDLQGSLYREIWKKSLAPRGKWCMINVGNAKTDRNSRIVQWIPIIYLDRQLLSFATAWDWHEWTVQNNPRYRQSLLGQEWISVLDGVGMDHNCQNEDIKYGWLTTYYQRLATLGGFSGRHFLAGGFNGDWQADGKSGRSKWLARHWVPAMRYDVGDPIGSVEQVDAGERAFEGAQWTWRLYRAKFEHADVYHFPNYLRPSDFETPEPSNAPPQIVEFDEPHDILKFDGSWQKNQTRIVIPPASGRIVRRSQSHLPD
ncbi:MAG: hypothetical protein MPJ50_10550 [Pirellulales bacterium]|nr:hypothetical protein [Pirellulales bacterium]